MTTRRRAFGKRGEREQRPSIGLPPPLPGHWPEPAPALTPEESEADNRRRRWIRACAVFGTVVVIVGLIVIWTSGGSGTTSGTNDELCTNEALSKVVPAGLWLLWLLLLGVAISAMTLRKRMVRPDTVSKRLAIIGMVSAIVLFPAWLNVASGMNCGL